MGASLGSLNGAGLAIDEDLGVSHGNESINPARADTADTLPNMIVSARVGLVEHT